jgi:hypothetical protein
MRKRWIILFGATGAYLAIINLTNDPPAYAYAGAANQIWVATGLDLLSPACLRQEETEFGPVITSIPLDQCFRMTAPQRMKGVWIDEFEASRFVPGARDTTNIDVEPFGIWLNIDRDRSAELNDSSTELQAFEIEFIGRQTLYPGHMGHMGVFEHEVIVDQLISARPVDATPYARKQEEWMRRMMEASRGAE